MSEPLKLTASEQEFWKQIYVQASQNREWTSDVCARAADDAVEALREREELPDEPEALQECRDQNGNRVMIRCSDMGLRRRLKYVLPIIQQGGMEPKTGPVLDSRKSK